MRHIEAQIQAQVVRWIQYQYPQCLFTGGFAGETMNIQRAVRRKQMGYRAGSPDLIIFVAKQGYHGLMIEMKSPGGKESPAQVDFHVRARQNGYRVSTCDSLADAQAEITAYLGEPSGAI